MEYIPEEVFTSPKKFYYLSYLTTELEKRRGKRKLYHETENFLAQGTSQSPSLADVNQGDPGFQYKGQVS